MNEQGGKNRNSFDFSPIPIIKDSELSKVRLIGSGGYGQVLLCNFSKNGNGTSRKVVLKQLLKGAIPSRDLKYLQNEAKILWGLNSPFVISLEGLNCSESQFSIVMQFAEYGSCTDFFGTGERKEFNEWQMEELWPLKSRIAFQVIQGMIYLHGIKPKRILHLDLKSQNVLLDNNLNVKLCDFGLSQMNTLSLLTKSLTCTYGVVTGKNDGRIRGTVSHIAPEHFKYVNAKPSVKSDAYSFGIFLWELMTNEQPYRHALQDAVILAVRDNGERPDDDLLPPSAPIFMVSIMAQCFQEKPIDRPDFKDMRSLFVD
uniref:Protein kinase domain-containing protein n=1 Tax=Ciona savignyi TaxID=51511 RepID=H2Z2A6_CIOSA